MFAKKERAIKCREKSFQRPKKKIFLNGDNTCLWPKKEMYVSNNLQLQNLFFLILSRKQKQIFLFN